MDLILSTTYFPSINYLTCLNNFQNILIENYEYHKRHSDMNRTNILGSNGIIMLTVPIKKKSKTLIKDVKIADNLWKKKHIKSIQSAYGSSPFFIHYFDEINKLINKRELS